MSNLGTLDTEKTHKDGLNKSVRRISHAPQDTNKNQDHQPRMQCNTDLCSVFSKIMFTSSVRTGFDLQGAAEFEMLKRQDELQAAELYTEGILQVFVMGSYEICF